MMLCILACVLSGSQAMAASLVAQLDRTQVSEGESVTLSLSATGDVQGNPDLSPLRADFDILGQSQGSRFNMINGNIASSREWQLQLLPKHSGKLSIPALQLGSLHSQPLSLQVSTASADQSASGDGDQPVILEIDTDTDTPWVQAEIRYTLRLLARVPLREASLTEPQAGDALVEKLGDDKEYAVQRNGATYQVVERQYAIFPQHSGSLTIDSPLLAASVPVPGNRNRSGNSPFADMQRFMGRPPAGFPYIGGMFAEMKPLRLRGRAVTLEVRPQPDSVAGAWLPAKSLALAESWLPDPPVFRVGEPVTRSVSLIAQGLSAAQLPELALNLPDHVKAYPDQPQSDTDLQGNDLVATRTQKTALVPTTAGDLVLPEIKVSWWDTETQQARIATLPARHITVLADTSATTAAPDAVIGPTSQPAARVSADNPVKPATQATPSSDTAGAASYWPWIAGGLLLAWLVTLLLWLRSRSQPSPDTPQAVKPPDRNRQHELTASRSQLKKACMANDAKAATKALRDWAAARWPETPPKGLPALAQRLNHTAAQREILALDRRLYAANSADWNGAAAWSILEAALVTARDTGKAAAEPLPELYPRQG
jgi:hypothetical protein